MESQPLKYNPAFLSDEALIESFVIRMHEFDVVMEVVRENSGDTTQHVLVIGPRGIGKTTLVHRVAAEIRRISELEKIWYPVTFGEESYGVGTAGEFWLEALFQIGEQTGEERWRDAHAELSSERDPDRLGRRALAQLSDFMEERDRRLLLVVENLNMLVGEQISENEAWTFRHTLQNEPRIMLLGTATKRFGAIESEGQALYELFRLFNLEPLQSPEEVGALWALSSGEKTKPGFMRAVEIITGGNPRLIRILSEFAAKTSFRDLTDNLVRLIDDHTDYLKHHFDALPPQERKVFAALAERWDPGSARDISEITRLDINTVSTLLGRLENKGAVSIRKLKGRTKLYQVAERLYNVYYLMRRRGHATARVRAAVRFMVQLYEGDALIPAVRSLVDEACQLTPEKRRDHYLAYSQVLDIADPQIRDRILAETRDQFLALSDVPPKIKEILSTDNTYNAWPLDSLLATDFTSLAAEKASQFAAALFRAAIDRPGSLQHRAILDAVDHALKLDPDSIEITLYRGMVMRRLGRDEEALAALNRVLELGFENVLVYRNRGLVLERLDRYEDALASYDRALELDAKDVKAHRYRTDALVALGRYEEALASINLALEADAENVWSHLSQANVLAHLDRYEDALASCERVLELNAKNVSVHKYMAFVLHRLGRFEDALASYDRALELDNTDVWTHSHRGSVLARLDRYEDALPSYNSALELDAHYEHALHGRGVALEKLDRHMEALVTFRRALETSPRDSHLLTHCGNALSELDRFEESLAAYNQALEFDPENGWAHLNRGLVLERLERYEDALASYDRLLELNDDDIWAHSQRGSVLAHLDQYEDAVAAYDRALEHEPHNATTLNSLSVALCSLGYYEEAVNAADRAIEIEPDDPWAWGSRGEALVEQGNFDEALDALSKALHSDQVSDTLKYATELASALAARGRTASVLQVLRRSPAVEYAEPLEVALQMDLKEEVEVAQEIDLVARDVLSMIETKRAELK